MKRTAMFDEMNRHFEELFRGVRTDPFGAGIPIRTDIEDGGYRIHADLPGFETTEIDLRFEDGRLMINAAHETDGEGYGRREVRESVSVPGEVDVDRIEANYRNGVLEVFLPAEDETGRQIEIE